MELQYTLQHIALQLKNQPGTLINVAKVVQKIMKTLYGFHFPNASAQRPGRNPRCSDSDILTIAWLLEYIGADSENCTAIGNSGHSLRQDCGIISIYLKGVSDGETKTKKIHR